jgi:hypothetical protein
MVSRFEIFKWAGWVLFIIFLLLNKCNNVTDVVIPEKPGSFAPDIQVVHVPVDSNIEVPKWYKDTKTEKQLANELKDREERIKVYEEELSWMQGEFAYMDSIQKANAYKEAISLKEFNSVFENDTIIIDIKGIVRGEVKEIQPYYLIKEQTISIPNNKKINLLLGAGTGISTEMNQFTAKVNLSLQNKQQNIYTISYQRIGEQNFGLIEYNFKL